ncbi:hypothetical protein EJB05_28680, partial [Eragrostis curvula]
MEDNTMELIVGAGPAGLATAACLTQLSIAYVIVEREDCSASLWRKRTYNRLKLHLAQEFCELTHMSCPTDAPTYIPKGQFVKYLDDYIDHFNIRPKYDEGAKFWFSLARNMNTSTILKYTARFLVVASGENSAEDIPIIQGLDSFPGESASDGAPKARYLPQVLHTAVGHTTTADVWLLAVADVTVQYPSRLWASSHRSLHPWQRADNGPRSVAPSVRTACSTAVTLPEEQLEMLADYHICMPQESS